MTARSVLFALGFTTLGATVGLTAGAFAGHSGRSMGGAMKFAHAMAGLDLSAEQQQLLTDLRAEIQADIASHRDENGDEMTAFVESVAEGKDIDRAALHRRIDEAAAARTVLAHKVIDGLVDVYDSLDATQKGELADLVRTRMQQQERRQEQFGGEGQPARP
jgi:hypothetical protein